MQLAPARQITEFYNIEIEDKTGIHFQVCNLLLSNGA